MIAAARAETSYILRHGSDILPHTFLKVTQLQLSLTYQLKLLLPLGCHIDLTNLPVF